MCRRGTTRPIGRQGTLQRALRRSAVTIQRFGTEQDFDYVRLYDGDSNSAGAVAELTGAMRDLQQTTFTSSSTDMVVEFTSDESVGDEGFEASYLCSRDAPPPPPPGPVFVPITPGGGMTQGNVDSEVLCKWAEEELCPVYVFAPRPTRHLPHAPPQ